ncbi:peptidoglycan recognition protein family protein [Flavilitoribacter nigricans]|uniref:N-acetylmuramoyl-L-alanine amidase n=1 Tax=Flavilitoribacter nigricans (strain ATCC 23147 / DSM 23189 / NBRC 102662 / NCIMB 1420 / SS-2) TaxID=1122177 RepID=A0A2D0NEF5_FLAN2|nr:peptidoglycan recognition family protein [Flavilitoribacter nigricans]PHN06163.1 hypothetical protein CRP01_11300 [Flavilitoribacter nigricans DSM 23189 = NBRC 102662]
MVDRSIFYSAGTVLVLILLIRISGRLHAGKWWLIDLRTKLPVHPERKFSRRSLSQIDTIVVHHTAGPVTQTPADIARYHTGPGNHICAEGCPGISYHFLIDRAGLVYQVNDLEAVSFHVSGANTRSVGICLIGNYSQIEPTATQLRRLRQTIRLVERKAGRQLNLTAHRDYKATDCPGDNIVLHQV